MNLREVVRQRKLLLQNGVLEKLASLPAAQALEVLLEAEKKAEESRQIVITLETIDGVLSEKNQGKKIAQAPVEVETQDAAQAQAQAAAETPSAPMKILSFKKYDCDGTVEDFVSHFRNRFAKLSSMLKNRVSAANGVTSAAQNSRAVSTMACCVSVRFSSGFIVMADGGRRMAEVKWQQCEGGQQLICHPPSAIRHQYV